MSVHRPDLNNRVLVIDDMTELHGVFRKLLSPKPSANGLADLESMLFASSDEPAGEMAFEVDCASQGEEGLARVRSALAEHRPYAVAFVDMRMPPGWDGLQTIEAIWREYHDLEIVICTAHSDYSDRDIAARLGASDQVLFLRKPFDANEVRQLARTLSEKWTRGQRARRRLTELELQVDELTRELSAVNRRLLDEAAQRQEAASQIASLVRRLDELTSEKKRAGSGG